jgi:hypothetical protein
MKAQRSSGPKQNLRNREENAMRPLQTSTRPAKDRPKIHLYKRIKICYDHPTPPSAGARSLKIHQFSYRPTSAQASAHVILSEAKNLRSFRRILRLLALPQDDGSVEYRVAASPPFRAERPN